jgi:hypothetical protein
MKSVYKKQFIIFLFLLLILPTIIASVEDPDIKAPSQPFNLWGQAYIDGDYAPEGYILMTLINKTVYGTFTIIADGWYSIDTYGDHTGTPTVREGGRNGDIVYYIMKKDNGPGRKWYGANDTFIFECGGFNTEAYALNFSAQSSPWPPLR